MSVLGVDIGGTNVRVALVRDGEIVEVEKHPRPGLPDDLVVLLREVSDGYASGGREIEALGVGCAGLIRTDGVIATSPNIPGYDGFPLRDALETAVGIPVAVDNDATAALWAEMRSGAAVGYRDVQYVSLGTGIGGGIAIDGAARRGGQGFAAEIGHMVIDVNGPECTCGRRGCWETLASGRALGAMAREAAAAGRASHILELAGGDVEKVVGEHVGEALIAGHDEAEQLLDRLGHWIGVGIGNLVTIFDPELVVIGGGLAAMGQPLVDAADKGVRESTPDYDERGGVKLALVEHATDGGSLGAALIAAELL